MDSASSSMSSLQQWVSTKRPWSRNRRAALAAESRQTPTTSQARQKASLAACPLDLAQLVQEVSNDSTAASDTVLYLGYASNLSAETFLGRRNIHPISQVNVVVPDISLTFDLPGIPYTEPCFGNSRYRTSKPLPHLSSDVTTSEDYHKDRWPKGLVGVVYEVTKADYVHIIATEGGGSGYQDVLVDCHVLSSNPRDKVPETPTTTPFKAHTLLAPVSVNRPDHSYAQPSARYLKLIADGAAEHSLPYEYQDYLHQIRPYQLTTVKQRMGQFIFLSLWAPVFAFFFGGGGTVFLQPDGTYPEWFATLSRAIFMACWASYDGFFKPLFGDGERTIGDASADVNESREKKSVDDEKAPLIRDCINRYGIGGRLDHIV